MRRLSIPLFSAITWERREQPYPIAFDRKHDPATVNGKKCGDDQNAMMNYADNFVDGNTTIQICEYFPDTGNTVIDLIEKTICHEMKMKNRKGAKE